MNMKQYNFLYLFITIIITASLFSCGGAKDTSQLRNKILIEIKVIGKVSEAEAISELLYYMNGFDFTTGFRVPAIEIKDITYESDSTKIKTTKLSVPLSYTDGYALEFTDGILDKSTYQDNLEDYKNEIENDSSFISAKREFSKKRGQHVLKSEMPSLPLKTNEYFISSLAKTDTANHQFKSGDDLISYLKITRQEFKNLVVYYLGEKSLKSFMDSDGDGVTDNIDRCANVKGSVECEGCPCPSNDTDGDGVLNIVDKCPTQAGPSRNFGCPLPDDDKDGTPNDIDKCPKEAGRCNGCPCPSNDRDNDGVLNNADKCPDDYGPTSNYGCPLKPEITHSNNEGKFYFKNVDFQKQTVEMTIKLMDGSSKVVFPQKPSFPSTGEYDNLTRELTQAAGITVTVKVSDKTTKALVVPQFTISNLSLVCLKPEPGTPKKCGFMNTDL